MYISWLVVVGLRVGVKDYFGPIFVFDFDGVDNKSLIIVGVVILLFSPWLIHLISY